MPSDDEVHRLRTEVPDDEEIETTIQRLRKEGHSRLEAVRLILDVLDVSLAEAKTLLLTNDTWAEVRGEVPEADGQKTDDGSIEDPVPPAPG